MSTAPAPNAAAPPGMCPGIATLGGGGDAGGSGGGGDGDGSGNGGGGKGDGKGANPDDKGAASGGEPIDVITGRVYTLPITDLVLSGPVPLVFRRVYSTSLAERDIGLGFGWTHSLAWRVEVGRAEIRVWNDRGIAVDFDAGLAVGAEAIGRSGWLLRREATGFTVDVDDGLLRRFGAAGPGGREYALTSIEDRSGNRIELRYDGGRLAGATDSVGREVRFSAGEGGRTASVEVKNAAAQGRWVAFARYEHDAAGCLVRALDAGGHAWSYTYDGARRLTSHTDRAGLTFHYVYDHEGRGVESWGAHAGADPSLDEGVPETLADGTRAKGIFHTKIEFGPNGYREVTDSRGMKRFFGNALGLVDKLVDGGSVIETKYDERGFAIAEVDAVGATQRWERDARGRVLKAIDAHGGVTTVERDAEGRVARATDVTGATTEITRDARGLATAVRGPTGAITRYVYDARGLVSEVHDPMGGVRRLQRDAQGSVVQMVEPGGAVWRWTYDFWGRTLSVVAPTGATLGYAYSDRGDLVAKTGPDGGVTRYRFDGERHLVEQTDPVGRAVSLAWGGYHSICARTDENGHTVRLRYDRECDLVRVVNERGESHRLVRGGRGQLLEEHTFDGRVLRYRYDPMGRLVRVQNGAGAVTEMELGIAGEVLRRKGEDGSVETFEYDPRGLIASVEGESGRVRLAFERDAVGRIVRETQVVDGEAFSVDVSYDLLGRRVGRRTSSGHSVELSRDRVGDVVGVRLDGAETLAFARDGLGRETARQLPGGGRIDSAFDIAGRLVRRAASRTVTAPRVGPGEPGWVGAAPQPFSCDKVFRYDGVGDLVETWDSGRGRTRFEHDPVGRLLGAVNEDGSGERFAFDATDNLFEAGPGAPERRYGPGNRLIEKAGIAYEWDESGRLKEKRRTLADGAVEVTRYRWNGRGLLESVERADGTVVAFRYDAFARRVEKRVLRPGGGVAGAAGRANQVVSVTRFRWDRHVPVQEVRRGGVGDEGVEERTYVFDDGSFEPLAQKEGSGGWVHSVNDQIGTPERLIDGRGEVVGELRLGAWGDTIEEKGAARTPLRFQGQYRDEETGLHYNRHRYYDPEVGRFISPDPIGMAGGMNAFQGAQSPVVDIDPFGLARTYPFDVVRHEGELSAEEQKFKGQILGAYDQHPPGTGKCRQLAEIFEGADPNNRQSIEMAPLRGNILDTKPGVAPPKGWVSHHAAELGDNDHRVVDVDRGMIFQNRQQWLEHTLNNPKSVQVIPATLPGQQVHGSFDRSQSAFNWQPKFSDGS